MAGRSGDRKNDHRVPNPGTSQTDVGYKTANCGSKPSSELHRCRRRQGQPGGQRMGLQSAGAKAMRFSGFILVVACTSVALAQSKIKEAPPPRPPLAHDYDEAKITADIRSGNVEQAIAEIHRLLE